MSDTECVHCGATDEPEDGIEVGLLGELNENVCTVCRADYLSEYTVLSRREAEIAAYKQLLGSTNQHIADGLGLSKSTVDEYYRRMKEKVEKAATTVSELEEYV